jgi:hypothetical protein
VTFEFDQAKSAANQAKHGIDFMAATKTKTVVKTTAQNLESRFDAGDNVLDYFDATTALRRNLTPQKVNVDFPAWVVKDLDKEADRLGVARQSLIKVWIVERL